jgi:hypothetical protein
MVSGDSRMVSGEVASKLDSRGPFQGESYSDRESNLPKVEVAGSIPVSRSISPREGSPASPAGGCLHPRRRIDPGHRLQA